MVNIFVTVFIIYLHSICIFIHDNIYALLKTATTFSDSKNALSVILRFMEAKACEDEI